MVTRLRKPVIVKGDDKRESLGLIHIITGEGKGKTTASLGLALRAVGYGLKVYMIQFLKCCDTGELFAVQKYMPNITIVQYGTGALGESQKRIYEFGGQVPDELSSDFEFKPDMEEKEAAELGVQHALRVLNSKACDLLILDEVNCVVDKDLVTIDDIRRIVDSARENKIELVLTGRDAPKAMYEFADYVSSIDRIKHPWQKGIKARKGVEY